HIATLTAARPKGPVHLCGWSVGGLLASEMARQLEAAGRPVTSLILVDTHPGTARADATRDPATQRAMFAQLTAGLSPPAAVVDAADDQQFLQRLQAHAVEQGRLLHDRRLPALQRHWRVFCALVRASHTYRPEPHDSPIDLIQTSFTPAPLAAEQQRDCQRLTRGGLTTHRVAGDHHSILQPPAVRATAERIEEILRGS
ncbi:MAG: thioesterase domain-containing protein, partial [Acidobacteriota bacterium]